MPRITDTRLEIRCHSTRTRSDRFTTLGQYYFFISSSEGDDLFGNVLIVSFADANWNLFSALCSIQFVNCESVPCTVL